MSDLDLKPTLTGELLRLRPLLESDFESLYAVASDPLIWQQLPQSNRYEREVFTPLFQGWMKSPGSLAAIDRRTNEIIGTSRYYEYEPNLSVGIGYTFLARAYWGQSYNREMKQLMITHAFGSVRRVIFHVAECNIRSQKAVQKIGATFVEKTEKEVNGLKSPYYLYQITRPE